MAQWYKWDKIKLIDCIRLHETDFKFNEEHVFTYAEHRVVTQAKEQQTPAHTTCLCTEEKNSSLHKLEMKEYQSFYAYLLYETIFVFLKCTYLRTEESKNSHI